ncbi:hypothetical protein [Sphingobacterium pedocola]|uniref:Polyprenyl synthetase n=1 Tax=Sphingobacterium pedocola TaxID=2082722 RepID=A0ABR9T7A1_9SPHI|nr:hypothetical protein [Sphingobacterium pedocola]MBE8721208.1 hypothetical protein [Sphingobacterium pedocola]
MKETNRAVLPIGDEIYDLYDSREEIQQQVALFNEQLADGYIDEALKTFAEVYPTIIYRYYAFMKGEKPNNGDWMSTQVDLLVRPLNNLFSADSFSTEQKELLYQSLKQTFNRDLISTQNIWSIAGAAFLFIDLCVDLEKDIEINELMDELHHIDLRIGPTNLVESFYYIIAKFRTLEEAIQFAKENLHRDRCLAISVSHSLMSDNGEQYVETVRELLLPKLQDDYHGAQEKYQVMEAVTSLLEIDKTNAAVLRNFLVRMFKEHCELMERRQYQLIKDNSTTQEWEDLFPKLEKWAIAFKKKNKVNLVKELYAVCN